MPFDIRIPKNKFRIPKWIKSMFSLGGVLVLKPGVQKEIVKFLIKQIKNIKTRDQKDQDTE